MKAIRPAPQTSLLRKGERIRQAGALPYRLAKGAGPQILLVTSRETKRWVIPKGNIDYNRAPHKAAEIEAVEEAGVRGRIATKPAGSFRYLKRLASGNSVKAKVVVYPLEVREELAEWKEQGERTRSWFAPADAAAAVDEEELAKLIRRFGRSLAPSSKG